MRAMRRDRLEPRAWQADYIQLRALTVGMRRRIEERWQPGADIHVADIGCGDRPYQPLFAGRAGRYVGVDIAPGPGIDVVATAGDLPFESASFDCVLLNGVLQLVPDPDAALREIRRVLAPGGMLLLSTHGVGFADRASLDRWRWTHHGLAAALESVGPWRQLEILPAGGVLSAAAYLVGGEAEFAAHHAGAPLLAAPLCAGLNLLAWRGDLAVRWLFPDLPPDASVNYLACATAPAA